MKAPKRPAGLESLKTASLKPCMPANKPKSAMPKGGRSAEARLHMLQKERERYLRELESVRQRKLRLEEIVAELDSEERELKKLTANFAEDGEQWKLRKLSY